jgi:predicted CopG family antitoxin
MKARLQIDDDVYEAAERLASSESRSIDEVLSDLARKGLDAERGQVAEEVFPVFVVSKDSPPITSEMVKAALDDDL